MLRRGERERKLPEIPTSYGELKNRDDCDQWLRAVNEELKSMETNGVWTLTACPDGVRKLKSKWVFRIKEDENGQAVRCKARLVAKGYQQRAGIDYEETYAPVAKLPTVRTVLAVGVQYGFHFHQMDVKTAFLHGKLKEEIYMAVPEGVDARPGTVCRLMKSLYGLKQSPRFWNDRFNQQIVKMGFERSRHDYCLYVKCTEDDELYIILYVDDLLIVGRKIESISELKKKLSRTFSMTDCGEARYFLGIKLDLNRNTGTLRLSQKAHVEKILRRFRMTDCNSTKTPMEKKLVLRREGKPYDGPYREMLGSLMYLMLCVRPDICFPVGYMGRFQHKPTDEHFQSLKRIIKYLKGTSDVTLDFKKNTKASPLIGYADADWATDTEDRKSVSGYIFQVFGCTVSWSSKKQSTVATSSSEAEYVALSAAATEALWLSGILEDLKMKDPKAPVELREDNQGCIGMARNPETKRSKHIDIKHHFIRDHVAAGHLTIEHVPTQDQLTDLMTKPLDVTHFNQLRSKLGLSD